MKMHKNLLPAYIIAGISDLSDFVGIGMIPILGEIIDFITAILLYPYIGPWAFGGFLEILSAPTLINPIVDLPPIHTAIVFAYDSGILQKVKL